MHQLTLSLLRCRCLFVSFLAAFFLRMRLARMNKKRAEMLAAAGSEKKPVEKNEEVYDDDPRYVFMT